MSIVWYNKNIKGVENVNFRLKCPKCEKELAVLANMDKVKVEVDGEEIYLTIVRCPECGELIIIQPDNKETEELKEKIVKYIIRRKEAERFGYKFPKKQTDKMKQADLDLNKIRKDLVKKLEGKTVTVYGERKEICFDYLKL